VEGLTSLDTLLYNFWQPTLKMQGSVAKKMTVNEPIAGNRTKLSCIRIEAIWSRPFHVVTTFYMVWFWLSTQFHC
jgi:hypothetical protein